LRGNERRAGGEVGRREKSCMTHFTFNLR